MSPPLSVGGEESSPSFPQDRENRTIPEASVIGIAPSTSGWAAVDAYPSSVSGSVLREQIVPAKRTSERLVVSQSPGRWASTYLPKSSKSTRPLIVERGEDT